MPQAASSTQERSSDNSSSSNEWVFNRRDHTTPLPRPGYIGPPDNPLRHPVTNLDFRDASPQLMARGPRTLRGNITTATASRAQHAPHFMIMPHL